MSAHHCLPGPSLTLLLFGRVVRVVADGGGVDEQLGPLQGHQPCGLGVPLVPADQHAQPSYAGVDRLKAEVARGEVELLVIAGVVGDVHLAVFAGYGAILLEHDGRVVVQADGTTLEERGHQHHARLFGYLSVEVGRQAGNRLGQVKVADVFRLAEVEPVVQLL